jgi:hypothetical protein
MTAQEAQNDDRTLTILTRWSRAEIIDNEIKTNTVKLLGDLKKFGAKKSVMLLLSQNEAILI